MSTVNINNVCALYKFLFNLKLVNFADFREWVSGFVILILRDSLGKYFLIWYLELKPKVQRTV